MINYTVSPSNANTYSINKNKKNILLIGKANSSARAKLILNPVSEESVNLLYGPDSELSIAYKKSLSITRDTNIYTVNCPIYTDFIEIIDVITQYNFDFIVPISLNLRDTFYNPLTDTTVSFASYYLQKLKLAENHSILIMSDYKSSIYYDMDEYLKDMENVFNTFQNNNEDALNMCGNNLVFVLDNFTEEVKSNVILAASLSVVDFASYPSPVKYHTYFDIDYSDVKNKSFCFYKYYQNRDHCTIEQLNNCKYTNDIYKRVLIDMLIKHVVKALDLSEFAGTLYNPYVQIKIESKVEKVLSSLSKSFVSYKINRIGFNKTGIGVGTIIVDVSIVPHSILETINILMEL